MKRQTRSARTPRFHHEGVLQANSRLTLSRAASHHLMTVLRTREGDVVELFNGDGCNYRATVIETGHRQPGRCAILQLDSAEPATTESPVFISLLQGISRGDRMDISIRQSVELGVKHIQPLYTRHSAKALDEKRTAKKIEHWQSILISACEQSGRTDLPELAAPTSLDEWARAQEADDMADTQTLVLDPLAETSLLSCLQNHCDAAPPHIALLIGPESGLDTDEIDTAVAAGAKRVCVGPRVLRTETAGPACIAIVQSQLGDLREDSDR